MKSGKGLDKEKTQTIASSCPPCGTSGSSSADVFTNTEIPGNIRPRIMGNNEKTAEISSISI